MLSVELIVLVAMFALLLCVILYMVKDFMKDFYQDKPALGEGIWNR